MTVHTIDTSFQYPAPDMNKIYKSREELNYKIRTLGNLYLPVLAEELKGLEKEINITDAQALKAITLIPSALQTSEIQQYYTIIENLKNENPTSEQKEAIDSFYGEIKSLIGNSTTETLKLFTELNNSLTNLQAVTLSDNQYRINELDTSILKISPQLSEEESAIERLVTDEAALNEAIKIIEAIDTFSLIKDAFLSLEKLAALNLSAPQLELVKAGIGAAGKILDLVSNAIKYDNLVTARRQTQTKLDNRRLNLAGIKKELKTLEDRKFQLLELQAIKNPRETYTHEISTLTESVEKFLQINSYEASDDLHAVVKRFIEQTNVFVAHLNSLRKEWRS